MKIIEISRDEFEEYLTGSKSEHCEYYGGNVFEEDTGNIIAFLYDFGNECKCYKIIKE
jgi:hypothetical protein